MTHLCAECCSAYLSIKFYLIFLSLLRLYVKEPIDQTTLVHESHIIFCLPISCMWQYLQGLTFSEGTKGSNPSMVRVADHWSLTMLISGVPFLLIRDTCEKKCYLFSKGILRHWVYNSWFQKGLSFDLWPHKLGGTSLMYVFQAKDS